MVRQEDAGGTVQHEDDGGAVAHKGSHRLRRPPNPDNFDTNQTKRNSATRLRTDCSDTMLHSQRAQLKLYWIMS